MSRVIEDLVYGIIENRAENARDDMYVSKFGDEAGYDVFLYLFQSENLGKIAISIGLSGSYVYENTPDNLRSYSDLEYYFIVKFDAILGNPKYDGVRKSGRKVENLIQELSDAYEEHKSGTLLLINGERQLENYWKDIKSLFERTIWSLKKESGWLDIIESFERNPQTNIVLYIPDEIKDEGFPVYSKVVEELLDDVLYPSLDLREEGDFYGSVGQESLIDKTMDMFENAGHGWFNTLRNGGL